MRFPVSRSAKYFADLPDTLTAPVLVNVCRQVTAMDEVAFAQFLEPDFTRANELVNGEARNSQ